MSSPAPAYGMPTAAGAPVTTRAIGWTRPVGTGPMPAERSSRRSGVLPETDQVALGVVHVGAETHVPDRLAADRHLAAQFLDSGERLVQVGDADGDDRGGDRPLAGQHAAIDAAGLGEIALFVRRRRGDQRVL